MPPKKGKRKAPRGAGAKPRFTKAKMIEALRLNGGLLFPTAKALGCAYNTVKNYIKRYPEVQEAIDEINENVKDMAEGHLYNAIKAGDMKVIMFYLDRKAGDRGYGNKITQDKPFEFKVVGQKSALDSKISLIAARKSAEKDN